VKNHTVHAEVELPGEDCFQPHLFDQPGRIDTIPAESEWPANVESSGSKSSWCS
jgi:hypothetical protein